jgi:hypothetical protein
MPLKFYLYRKDHLPIDTVESFDIEGWPPANLLTAHNIIDEGFVSILESFDTEINAVSKFIKVFDTLPNGYKRVLYIEYNFNLPDELLISDFKQRLFRTVNSMLKYAHSDYTFSDMKPDILTEPIGAVAGGKRKKRVSSKRKYNKRRSSHRRKH